MCSQHQKYVNRVRTWYVSWSLNHTFLMSQTSQIWIESLICDVIYLVCFSYHALMSAALVLGEVTLTRIFQRPLLMHQQPFLWLMVAHNDHLLGWWSLPYTCGRWLITVNSDHIESSKLSHWHSRIFADVRRWSGSQESATLEARQSAHCRVCAGVCSGSFLKLDVLRNWRLLAHLLQTTQRILESVWNC